jgi:hypothetical protein
VTYIPRNLLRTKPSYTLVNPGAPVRAAGTWRDLADGIQWIAGKGACLVPWMNTSFQIAAGVTKTLRFRVRPRGKAIRRMWGLMLQPNTLSVDTSVTIRAPASTGTAVTVDLRHPGLFWQPFTYIEELAAKSSTEQEISIDIASIGGTTNVLGVQCYEQDRSALNDDATDYGIRVETVVPRAPMIDVAQTSLRGVYDAFANMDARRVGILHLALDTSEAFTRTSTGFLKLTNLPYKIQVPKLNSGATTQAVYWSCYARMATSGGTGGSVRLVTTTSAVTDTATITGTTFAWITSRSINVACDNFATVDGFRDDELSIEIAGDGTRTVEVASVSIWVDSVA